MRFTGRIGSCKVKAALQLHKFFFPSKSPLPQHPSVLPCGLESLFRAVRTLWCHHFPGRHRCAHQAQNADPQVLSSLNWHDLWRLAQIWTTVRPWCMCLGQYFQIQPLRLSLAIWVYPSRPLHSKLVLVRSLNTGFLVSMTLYSYPPWI